MTNLNKKAREIFDNIKISEKRSDEIMNKILNSNNNTKRVILMPIIASCLAVMIGVVSIVYADEIKMKLSTLNIQYREKTNDSKNFIQINSDSIVDINYDADLPENKIGERNNQFTYAELENLLNIKILKSNLFKNNILTQTLTTKVDNKISNASFDIKDLMNSTKEEYSGNSYIVEIFNMTFSFKTKYATDNNNLTSWFSGIEKDKYYIKSLQTEAVSIKLDENHYFYKFDYENISYSYEFIFTGNIAKEDINKRIVEVLESLEY